MKERKNMKERKSKYILFLMIFVGILMPQSLFAIQLPAIVESFVGVLEGIIVQILAGIIIIIMLVTAGWQMYENANAKPLKWAVAASIVIGGAVLFGDSIMAYAKEVFSAFTTGTSSVGLDYK